MQILGMDIHLGVPGIRSFSDGPTPLGSRVYGGHLKGIGGTGLNQFRVYGMYALVFLTGQCGGRFRDRRGTDRRVGAGDLMVIFPDVPHQYGPEAGDVWEEVFIAFSGAVFDGWETHGLTPSQPVWNLGTGSGWLDRFQSLLIPAETSADACRQVAGIHQLIADALAVRPRSGEEPVWLEQACRALADGGSGKSLEEISGISGLGYEAFRKAFRASTGESPGHYRNRMRILQGTLMLQRTELPLEMIAKSLGYCDAFHFSKAFKAHHGHPPAEHRRRQAHDQQTRLPKVPDQAGEDARRPGKRV